MLKIKRESKIDINDLKKDLDPVMQTSIYLRKSIIKKLKVKLADQEKTMKSIIEEFIEDYIK